jgi:hypothetical protein
VSEFQSPTDLTHNRGLIADPDAFAKEAGAASWLYLCGEEFAAMEGGCQSQTSRRPSQSQRI